MHAERALFGGAKTSQTAGHDEASAPGLSIATAYTLALVPQSQVEFAQPPGKGSKPEGMHAGLAKIRLVSAGAFRVALDVPAWIDVIAAGRPVPSRAFEGRHGCSAPHKVVEFDLPAGDALIQVSGASPDHVTLSVTPAPAPAT